MEFKLNYFREAAVEKERLDGSQLIIVNKGLKRIKTLGMQAGKHLDGDLKRCREIKHKQLGIRIIFRQHPGNKEYIDIIGIGRRAGKKVYGQANHRLNHHDPNTDVGDPDKH